MPANPKHLTKSKWQRFSKISAGILGSYLMISAFQLALTQWTGSEDLIYYTLYYALYLVWVPLMLLPFFFNNGWKCWGIYLAIIMLCIVAIYLETIYHPVAL
tara:strand:+ start:975 stop:1280 length:306 start_codon:yes stop_codon:yes gene_type:complete